MAVALCPTDSRAEPRGAGMEPLLPYEPSPQQPALTLERAGMVWEVGLVCIYCVNPVAQRCCQGQAAPCAVPSVPGSTGMGTAMGWGLSSVRDMKDM